MGTIGRKQRERIGSRKGLQERRLEGRAGIRQSDDKARIREWRSKHTLKKGLTSRLRVIDPIASSENHTAHARQNLPRKTDSGCDGVLSITIIPSGIARALDSSGERGLKIRTDHITGETSALRRVRINLVHVEARIS